MKIEVSKNKVLFNNGYSTQEIHPFWLRERANGETFVDLNTQQRLFDPTNLKKIRIDTIDLTDDFLEIKFSDGAFTKLKVNSILKEFAENNNIDIILSSNQMLIGKSNLDVTNENQWKELIHNIKAKFGRLDVLVNNAGIRESGDLQNTSLELWKNIINTNLTSIFLGCKYALPLLKKGKNICFLYKSCFF